jgi:pimeloyl-ACP methyl ester carboxylesterase
MRYTDSGSGPAVVLLDGLPWRLPTLRDALARQYRVLDAEIPGFGEPPSAGQYASIQELAAALDGALDSLGVERYSLIGVSFGADVALWRALSAPDRVESLILVSPTCILPTGAAPDTTASDATEEGLARLMLAHPEQVELPGVDPAALSRERALAQRLTGGTAALDSLAGLRCATLAVFGQEDRLVSPEAGRLYRERAPNCSVCFVYDAGHAIPLERPQALLNLATDFLERRETFVVENRGSVINP